MFGIVDKDAKIVKSVSIPTTGHGTAEKYVNACVEALKPLIAEVGGIGKIKAMGIGAPNGNYYSGCIEDAPNLEWRGNIPLVKMFQEALGIPVVLTNDANAAAIGEMAYGAARGMKNFIEITLGTGVGSGVVVNGQLVYGHDASPVNWDTSSWRRTVVSAVVAVAVVWSAIALVQVLHAVL